MSAEVSRPLMPGDAGYDPADASDAFLAEPPTVEELNAQLVNALDNVTASLETVMTWYGEKMGREDRLSRMRNIKEARELIERARKQPPGGR